MKICDVLNTEKEKIALFSISQDNSFAKEISAYFVGKKVLFPDNTDIFTVHTENDLTMFDDHYKIGFMDIRVLENKISDMVNNSKEFEKFTTVYEYELAYPAPVGKVITRENYDVLYITGVKTVSDRYLARETVKCIKEAPAVYLLDADSGYFEILRKAK